MFYKLNKIACDLNDFKIIYLEVRKALKLNGRTVLFTVRDKVTIKFKLQQITNHTEDKN